MAAQIYRSGANLIPSGGIQVGQWVFTGSPRVPYYEAEIVHIETGASPGTVSIVNDADFTGPITQGQHFAGIDTASDVDGWETGQIVEITDSATTPNVLVSRVVRVFGQATSATTTANPGTSFNVLGDISRDIQIGQIAHTAGGTPRRIIDIRTTVTQSGDTFTIVVGDGVWGGNAQVAVSFFRTVELDVIDPAGETLTGQITLGNLSNEDEGEHFTFIQNGHGNGPLYLTQGTLYIPDGLEITANTLS